MMQNNRKERLAVLQFFYTKTFKKKYCTVSLNFVTLIIKAF